MLRTSSLRALVSLSIAAAIAVGTGAAAAAAPASPAATAVATPGTMQVAGCTASASDCQNDVLNPAFWGSAATEADPARGVPGLAWAAVRWAIPNAGTLPFTLSGAAYEAWANGTCTTYGDLGAVITAADPVGPGETAYVVCRVDQYQWGSREITLSVTLTDADGSSPQSATAWIDHDVPIAMSATRAATLRAVQCDAPLADGTLDFEVRFQQSRAALERGVPYPGGVVLWISDAGNLEFDLDAGTYPATPQIEGSEPTAIFSPDDGNGMLGADPRLILNPSDTFVPVPSQYTRSGAGFDDRLSFSIPVRFDPDGDIDPILFGSFANMSAGNRIGTITHRVTNPCAAQASAAILPVTGAEGWPLAAAAALLVAAGITLTAMRRTAAGRR